MLHGASTTAGQNDGSAWLIAPHANLRDRERHTLHSFFSLCRAMSLRAATLARAPAATARSNLRPARRAPRAAPRARAGKGDGETDEAEATQQNGMTGAGLRQLIKMGLGTISGDITEINLDDPARTVVMVRACVRALV